MNRKHVKPADWEAAKSVVATGDDSSPHPDDLMLVVHQYMSDPLPFQIRWLFSAAEVSALRRTLRRQPCGLHPRRSISRKDREEIERQADLAYQRAAINKNALDFLSGWIKQTLRREPRPPEYSFLRHGYDQHEAEEAFVRNPHRAGPPRMVRVLQVGQAAPAQEDDPDAGLDNEPCVIQPEAAARGGL